MNRHMKTDTYLTGGKESIVRLSHVHVIIVTPKLKENRLFCVNMQKNKESWWFT